MANRDVEIIRSKATFVATLRRIAAAIEQAEPVRIQIFVSLRNRGGARATFEFAANAYGHESCFLSVAARGEAMQSQNLAKSAHWYDFTLTIPELAGYARRFAGRVETGRHSWSDPALGGPTLGDQVEIG